MKTLTLILLSILGISWRAAASPSFTPANPVNACGSTTIYFVCQQAELYSNITWYFGDGQKAYGKTVTHEYHVTGRYHVKMVTEKSGLLDSVERENFVVINNVPLSKFSMEESTVIDGMKRWFINESEHHADSFLNFVWEVNGVEISRNKHMRYEFAGQGIYKLRLTVTNNHGCSQASEKDIQVNDGMVIPVGLDDQLNSVLPISLYPNPSAGIMFIQSGAETVKLFIISDLTGRELMRGSGNTVNTEALPNGAYNLYMQTASYSIFQKFSKANM